MSVRLIIHHGRGRRSVSYVPARVVPQKVRDLMRAPGVTQVQIPEGFRYSHP